MDRFNSLFFLFQYAPQPIFSSYTTCIVELVECVSCIFYSHEATHNKAALITRHDTGIFTCSHAFVVHLSHTQKHTRAEWNSFAELISCFVEDIIRMMRSSNNNCLRAEWTKEMDNSHWNQQQQQRQKTSVDMAVHAIYDIEKRCICGPQSKTNTTQHSTAQHKTWYVTFPIPFILCQRCSLLKSCSYSISNFGPIIFAGFFHFQKPFLLFVPEQNQKQKQKRPDFWFVDLSRESLKLHWILACSTIPLRIDECNYSLNGRHYVVAHLYRSLSSSSEALATSHSRRAALRSNHNRHYSRGIQMHNERIKMCALFQLFNTNRLQYTFGVPVGLYTQSTRFPKSF